MKPWRPKNYKNPHKECPPMSLIRACDCVIAYDAGFDACLEALKPLIMKIARSSKLVDILYRDNIL